ncbi:hypothetical protein ACWY4P_22880 [Streptomyces sp. LZ34]
MSFDHHFQRRRRARNRLLMLAALVAAATLGAATFAVLTRDSGSEKASSDQKHSTSPPSSRPTSGSTEPDVLPNADAVKDGVPIGYPHTVKGAISAAAHFYDISDPFDPSAQEKLARITAVPGKEKELGDDAFRFAMALRSSAGLQPVGESDNANFYTAQSRAYRISAAKADKVVVWILTDTELSVRGVMKSETTVQTASLLWAEGDWKFTTHEDRGKEPRPVVPDSSEAVREGWRTLAYEK